MSLICLDEALETMTVDEWRKAHRHRGHVPILNNSGDRWCVSVYWVGICAGHESPPKPFLVEFIRPGDDGKEVCRSYWCCSLEEATVKHTQCLVEVHENKPKVTNGKRGSKR